MMFKNLANRSLQRENTRLEKRVADLQSELESERRRLAVAEAERDNLAAVVARDRERIRSEAACYAKERAQAEGLENEQRTR
jgi:DNA gyrase/topoisomerase IV subunit A